jgi:eukaryotic-like serine/threonine-protein kinase
MIGTTLGHYEIALQLGKGGMGEVYQAKDKVLSRDVAFAQIKTEKLDEDARTRIKRETQAMGRLGDHPNIVTVHDFGEDEGRPYMVLPLLPGGDIEDLIEKAPDHRLPLDKAIGIVKAISSGLVFAHSKGIIHRDLKPGNVWLSADGTAKIGDFGLAVNVDLSRLTESSMIVDTVAYMSPEQAMAGAVTPKTDLYSLGAMLYEMVSGRPLLWEIMRLPLSVSTSTRRRSRPRGTGPICRRHLKRIFCNCWKRIRRSLRNPLPR